jgi:hypothetical protein
MGWDGSEHLTSVPPHWQTRVPAASVQCAVAAALPPHAAHRRKEDRRWLAFSLHTSFVPPFPIPHLGVSPSPFTPFNSPSSWSMLRMRLLMTATRRGTTNLSPSPDSRTTMSGADSMPLRCAAGACVPGKGGRCVRCSALQTESQGEGVRTRRRMGRVTRWNQGSGDKCPRK